MRTLLLCFVLLYSFTTFAQDIPAQCESNDSTTLRFYSDAQRLVLRRAMYDSTAAFDSIHISESNSLRLFKAFLAVYNSNYPEVDTIFNQLGIHTFGNPNLNHISISADSNLTWMRNIRNGIYPTGNTTLDSLNQVYDFKNVHFSTHLNTFAYHTASFESSQNLNVYALAKHYKSKLNVTYVSPGGVIGDGDDVYDSIYSDRVVLLFSKGWGDCPAGCTERRFWKFSISDSCTIQYLGSYGKSLPSTGIFKTNSQTLKVYPNPFSNQLFVENIEGSFNFSIIDMLGRTVVSGTGNGGSITELSDLEQGQYVLRIVQGDKIYTKHLKKN
jgi:hypothetical protein